MSGCGADEARWQLVDRLRDRWGEVALHLRAAWPTLHRADLDGVSGSRQYLIELLAERLGWPEARAQAELDERLRQWLPGVAGVVGVRTLGRRGPA